MICEEELQSVMNGPRQICDPEIDPHYYSADERVYGFSKYCPLKPDTICKLTHAGETHPCICPRTCGRISLVHADRNDQRRDALGTSPDLRTAAGFATGRHISRRKASDPTPMAEPAFEPADLTRRGFN